MSRIDKKRLSERDMDDFINRWSAADQKRAIVQELEQKGIPFDALEGAVGRDYDPFDLSPCRL
jgi:type I restriction enzyme R subunit